jgi:hypothetical protein
VIELSKPPLSTSQRKDTAMRRLKGKVEKVKQKFKSKKKNISEAVVMPVSEADNDLDKLTDTSDVFGPVIEKIQVFAADTAEIDEVRAL